MAHNFVPTFEGAPPSAGAFGINSETYEFDNPSHDAQAQKGDVMSAAENATQLRIISKSAAL